MTPARPTFLLLAGPNGSGKSTMARGLVNDTWGIVRFLNADTIARGLAAYDPSVAAASAGRVMIEEMHRLIDARESFATETTLSGRMYAQWLRAKFDGYRTHLAFVYTRSADQNVRRVAARVAGGGHDIPEADIRRRYDRSFRNFFGLYRDRVQSWAVYDNSQSPPFLVAERPVGGDVDAYDPIEWQRLEAIYGQD